MDWKSSCSPGTPGAAEEQPGERLEVLTTQPDTLLLCSLTGQGSLQPEEWQGLEGLEKCPSGALPSPPHLLSPGNPAAAFSQHGQPGEISGCRATELIKNDKALCNCQGLMSPLPLPALLLQPGPPWRAGVRREAARLCLLLAGGH